MPLYDLQYLFGGSRRFVGLVAHVRRAVGLHRAGVGRGGFIGLVTHIRRAVGFHFSGRRRAGHTGWVAHGSRPGSSARGWRLRCSSGRRHFGRAAAHCAGRRRGLGLSRDTANYKQCSKKTEKAFHG